MLKVIVLILLLKDPHVLTAFFITSCKQLKPLEYCPPFNDSEWKARALCKNCTDGKKYHCCKNYDSPKLNCVQDIYDCKVEIFVDGCAEEKFCQKGEEPLLNFIKNQRKVDQPEVFCDLCYNRNRYNSHANKSSATYSECPYKKINICTPETHKIECGKPSDETRERFCRCDVRNGYFPYSHPDDHPSDGCSFTNYECRNDGAKCVSGQERLLDYTCAPFCKKGFYRPDNSDECIPYPTTENTEDTLTTASKTDKSTSHTDITTGSTTRHNDSNVSKPTSPPSIDDGKRNYLVAVPCAIGGFILLLSITLAILWKKGCLKRRTDGEEHVQGIQFQGTPSSSENKIPDPVGPSKPVRKLGKDGVPVATPDPSPGFRRKHTRPKVKQEKSDITESSESDADEETSFIERSRSSNSTPKHSRDAKTWFKLNDKEYRELVKKVLQRCHGEMLENLDPVPVLDWFTGREVFTETVLRDISEGNKTSIKIRELLKKLKERGTYCYMQFKESLLESKQDSCLRELEKQEFFAYKDILDQRKSAHSERDYEKEDLIERDEYTSRPLSEDNRFLSSSIGFEPTGNSCDDEQHIDGNCDQYSKAISGVSVDHKKKRKDENAEQSPGEARDVQQQELEDQARKYLIQLNDTATNFNTFVNKIKRVDSNIDERILQCPNDTVTKLECIEEEVSPEGFQAYKSSGINNSCLYQSVSILLRGDEQLQHRLRLKTTLHCCKEMANYTKLLTTHFKHENMDTVKQFFYNNVSAETWKRISEMNEIENVVEESLKDLITETACIGTDSSRLHVKFLSDALGMQIEQHFQLEEHFGESETVTPLEPIESVHGAMCLHIYWIDTTGNREKMNHIVPLLRKS